MRSNKQMSIWPSAVSIARVSIVISLCFVVGACDATENFAMAQLSLIQEIEHDYRNTASLTGIKEMQPLVKAAMQTVPRHQFVPKSRQSQAYINHPLPIGHGQTISQPFIVALMTDLLDAAPNDRVLEIGTGSGYQAAVLAEIVERVYTIEIVEALAETARDRLAHLGYDNVEVRAGDGNYGWPEAAPFDGIIVTAAGSVPAALIEQLKAGGRLVIPIEHRAGVQELIVITKHEDGTTSRRAVLPVRFVPLTGDN
jgi:protein-L-isoaspartate(D-aspartate) O-methyltransferase